MSPGLAAGRWPAEDGGPRRLQAASGAFAGLRGATPSVVSRDAFGATMPIVLDDGSLFVHGHAVDGDPEDQTCWVERVEPMTLETIARVDCLPGGPTWPGGFAAHADGSLIVAFGRHVHRLTTALELVATRALPRDRAHNSFVVLPDGHVVIKDFGGLRPGQDESTIAPPCQVHVLDPSTLETVSTVELPEPSIARLSADGDDVYVVGDHSLFRLRWNGSALVGDDSFSPRYRTIDGQTHGWDPVIALGAAWFLDNGAGSERYAGSFRGQGISTAPLHLVRVDLASGDVSLTEICGEPNGLVANPPLIDERRMIAVGFDSSNGVVAAFDIDDDGRTTPRWMHRQNHAPHMLFDPESGLVLTADHDGERWMEQLVVRDIRTGDEIVRIDSGSPLQSVVFPAAGDDRRIYTCSFSTLSSLSW